MVMFIRTWNWIYKIYKYCRKILVGGIGLSGTAMITVLNDVLFQRKTWFFAL